MKGASEEPSADARRTFLYARSDVIGLDSSQNNIYAFLTRQGSRLPVIPMVSRELEVGMAVMLTSVRKIRDLTESIYITTTIMELWSHNPACYSGQHVQSC